MPPVIIKTEPFRQAAYHALHAMSSRQTQDQLAPLLQALSSPSASVSAPGIARRLLSLWKRAKPEKNAAKSE